MGDDCDGLCERSGLWAEIRRLEKELDARREAFDERSRKEFLETMRAQDRAEKAEHQLNEARAVVRLLAERLRLLGDDDAAQSARVVAIVGEAAGA